MLNGHWSAHTLLHLALRTLFTVAGGYLIIDDMVVEKLYAQRLGEAAWVWSSKPHKVVFGVSVVLLVWTDGQSRIPVAFRVWHKGGLSKFDLALELLSYARNRLQCRPQFVLFDSWYPSKYCAPPHLIPHESERIVIASALLQALWHQPGVRKGPKMQQDPSWWDIVQQHGLRLVGGLLIIGLLGCASLTTSESGSLPLNFPSSFTDDGGRSDS
jgi:hypothetical protein